MIRFRSRTLCLDQFLKLSSIAETGGHAKVMIQGGEVKVNGETETADAESWLRTTWSRSAEKSGWSGILLRSTEPAEKTLLRRRNSRSAQSPNPWPVVEM